MDRSRTAWPGRRIKVEASRRLERRGEETLTPREKPTPEMGGLQEEKDGEDRDRDAEGKTWNGGQEIEQYNNRSLKRH